MKGVDPLISAVLIIAISIAAIIMVLEAGGPIMERTNEDLLLQEGKGNLNLIDNAVQEVSLQGTDATKSLSLSVSGGHYDVDNLTDEITFVMDTKQQIVGVGVSKSENDINITGDVGKITLTLSFQGIDLIGYGGFGKGSYKMILKNEGFDDVNQNQIISVKVQ